MSTISNAEPKIKLEYYSERFAKKLFKRFPQWRQYASHYQQGEPDVPLYFLDVRIPPVNPTVSEPLKITTYPQEIIVLWVGKSHRHFDSWPIRTDLAYMDQAIEFLEAIVTDQIVFGYYEPDGNPTGSGFYYGITANIPPKMLSTEHGSVIMRSWLGGHDRELHP